MAHPSLNWKAAIDELTIGRGLVSELGAMLPTGTDMDLVEEISGTFSRALVALNSGASEEEAQISAGSKKKIGSRQKGGARRRAHLGSCTRITTRNVGDGHSWRKYGQKNIYNSKYPRSYYRCTNKHDQNCPAMRQVQQSEEDPSLYVVTYIREHTCQRPTALTSLEKQSCIINFGPNAANNLPPLAAARQDHSWEEGGSSTLTAVSSASEYFATVEGSAELVSELMGAGQEHGDVTSSCLQPSKDDGDGLGWDLEEYFDFTNVYSDLN